MNKRRFIKLLAGLPFLPKMISGVETVLPNPKSIVNPDWKDAKEATVGWMPGEYLGTWAWLNYEDFNPIRFTVDNAGHFVAVKNEPNNGQK